MKLEFSLKALTTLLALAMLAPVTGQAAEEKWDFAIDSPAEFDEQAVEIRQEMADGRYSHLSERDQRAVESDLNRVSRLLAKNDDISRLNNRDQVELVNAQERINAILIDNEADRLVCKLESKVGTRMKTKRCLTVQEWAMVQGETDRAIHFMRGVGALEPSGETVVGP